MKFRPVRGQVLIQLIIPPGQVGSIVIPEAARDKTSTEGIVREIGENSKTEVKVGDRVVINRFEGIDVVIQNQPHKLFDPAEILATIN